MERKEAIEVIKKNWPDSSFTMLREALETLIPELKESEDESVRKFIIKIFKDSQRDGISEVIMPEQYDKIFAWLEKQGEQKLPIEKLSSEMKTVGESLGFTNQEECNRYNQMVTDLIMVDDDNGERKPAELPKGEDYGIDGLYHAIRILEETLGKVDGYQTDDGILEHKCAISAVKNLYEQKSSWSEEDEKFFKTALWHISNSISNDTNTDIHCDTTEWLKSIKERVQQQPKQEWSEEDEESLLDLIKFIENWKAKAKDFGAKLALWTGDEQKCDRLLTFLKSIRPQSTWRPSEEQMKILNEVLNFAANHESPYWNDYIFGTLNNLIRQLKKLRE